MRHGRPIDSPRCSAAAHNDVVSEFDDATHVADDGTCQIRDGWDIGGNANGGYLLAIAANGLRRLTGRPDPVTITAHYLAPGQPGSAMVTGEVVKSGKRFTTVSGALTADGRPMLQVLATFGDLADATSPLEVVTQAPPELPAMDACSPRSEHGSFPVPLMGRLDVRLRPTDAGFMQGTKSGVAEMAGWFAFADGRPIDTLALLLAADALPPAVFNLDIDPGWVPTIEFTVHVRAVPAPGPVRCLFRSHFVHHGMFEEDGEVWDSTGTLVAQSRQLALLPR